MTRSLSRVLGHGVNPDQVNVFLEWVLGDLWNAHSSNNQCKKINDKSYLFAVKAVLKINLPGKGLTQGINTVMVIYVGWNNKYLANQGL